MPHFFEARLTMFGVHDVQQNMLILKCVMTQPLMSRVGGRRASPAERRPYRIVPYRTIVGYILTQKTGVS